MQADIERRRAIVLGALLSSTALASPALAMDAAWFVGVHRAHLQEQTP